MFRILQIGVELQTPTTSQLNGRPNFFVFLFFNVCFLKVDCGLYIVCYLC